MLALTFTFYCEEMLLLSSLTVSAFFERSVFLELYSRFVRPKTTYCEDYLLLMKLSLLSREFETL